MRRIPTLILLLAAVSFTACGSDDDAPTGAGEGSTSTEPAAAFPVTVEHALRLDDRPGRARAARERLGGAKPTVLSVADGFEFEKIAGLKPDLIIGTNSGMTTADHEKFSALAPTIPGVKGGTEYFSPWDQQTELVAAAMGRAEEGRKLVEDVQDAYAKAAAGASRSSRARSRRSSRTGSTTARSTPTPRASGRSSWPYLGFTINPRLKEIRTPRGEQVGISAERFDVADADVMVFATETQRDIAALERIPTFGKLGAVREHRAVYTDATLSGAIYFMTPLSLPYVLERLTPALAEAVKGEAPRAMMPAP